MMAIALSIAGASDPAGVLGLCIAMTVALLVYVFYPQSSVVAAPEKTRLAFLKERKETVYDNLRDLNFEFKAGKFPESDYEEMRSSLEQEAAAMLAEIESLERSGSNPLFRNVSSTREVNLSAGSEQDTNAKGERN
jgi:hypothetical protein